MEDPAVVEEETTHPHSNQPWPHPGRISPGIFIIILSIHVTPLHTLSYMFFPPLY